MESTFERGKEASKTKELEYEEERLFKQVGRFSYELDWLKKKMWTWILTSDVAA